MARRLLRVCVVTALLAGNLGSLLTFTSSSAVVSSALDSAVPYFSGGALSAVVQQARPRSCYSLERFQRTPGRRGVPSLCERPRHHVPLGRVLLQRARVLPGTCTKATPFFFWRLFTPSLTPAFLSSQIEVRLVERLRARLLANLLRQETLFFDAHSSGELTSRLTRRVRALLLISAHVFSYVQ